MPHVADQTMAHIRQLDAATAEAAFLLVFLVRNAGIPLQITSSLRSSAQQAALVRAGRSRTQRSLHLTGNAFDVDIHGWDRSDIPRWWFEQLGQLGELLGLRWGGRFRGFWDPGHFENARAAR